MANYRTVLFDYDDTLVETYPARVIAAKIAMKNESGLDVDIERIMKEWAGRPQVEIFTDITGDRTKAEKLMERYARWYWDEGTLTVRLFPGVDDMLRGLKSRGIVLAMVTSKVRLLERDGRKYGAEVEMARLGLNGAFDLIVGWEDVREPKPSPGPILHALQALGADAKRTMMVGDSHIDITAAKRAGVASAGAGWGTLARDLLERTEPDYVLESPADLVTLLS